MYTPEQRPSDLVRDDLPEVDLGTAAPTSNLPSEDDIASVVPSQPGLRSDTRQHSGWLTLLWQY